jgi:hypothetical protein
MAGSDLPFPNGMRTDNSFGFRIGRRKRPIFFLILFCLFFVIWFTSDLSENTSDAIHRYLPNDSVSPDHIVNPEDPKNQVEEDLEQSEQEQALEEEIKNEEVADPMATKAKLVPQHYKYFAVIGSRAAQASRRSLIRETYFGIEDNIEPCMKRDKGIGYLFYIYGDEPSPKTPQRRSYETEKIEYNDLEKVNTDKFDQDQVLRWVSLVFLSIYRQKYLYLAFSFFLG